MEDGNNLDDQSPHTHCLHSFRQFTSIWAMYADLTSLRNNHCSSCKTHSSNTGRSHSHCQYEIMPESPSSMLGLAHAWKQPDLLRKFTTWSSAAEHTGLFYSNLSVNPILIGLFHTFLPPQIAAHDSAVCHLQWPPMISFEQRGLPYSCQGLSWIYCIS